MEEKMIATDGKFTVYASIGDMRLCTTSKLAFDAQGEVRVNHTSISEGCAIEHKCDDEGHYVVIAFVCVDKDGDYDGYNSVGDRIEQYCPTWSKVKAFRSLLNIAKDLIADNGRIEDND